MTATIPAIFFALLGVALGQVVFESTRLMIVFAVVGLWAGWIAGTLTVILRRFELNPKP